jgi:hypothetical protein
MIGSVVGCCEHGNEHLNFIKDEKFLDKLRMGRQGMHTEYLWGNML